VTSHAAYSRAQRLHRRHQGVAERHGPQRVQTKLRPGLGVSGYTAGVIVGDASDQTRAQTRENGQRTTL